MSALADSPVLSIPGLRGGLYTDPATLDAFADDFGHIVHHTPVAVLKPAAVEDVANAVGFCRRHGIEVAMRGQGHSTSGQSQVEGGLVIDSSTLNAIERVGDFQVQVQAGITWKDLLAKIVPLGLHPPVLTGLSALSVGGTLSMGGIGDASFRHGAQVHNVLELEVVTGEGELLRCSLEENATLFNAVLGGIGQYGLIVRATIPTVPVLPKTRRYVIPYVDPNAWFAAMHRLTSGGQVDGVYTRLLPPWSPLNPTGAKWVYALNASKFFEPSRPPSDADIILTPLNQPPQAVQVTDSGTFDFDVSVDESLAQLDAAGFVNVRHVWGDLFLPATQTLSFVLNTLPTLVPADLGPGGFVLVFPVRNLFPRAPAFRLPTEENVFLFDVLTADAPKDANPANFVSTEMPAARARFEAARAIGGTLYPIGSTPMSKDDWAQQYGQEYESLERLKDLYDPAHILTPGPAIFNPDRKTPQVLGGATSASGPMTSGL
jgi:cytokinin dehydrogenase